jgi:rhomboid protease GluP
VALGNRNVLEPPPGLPSPPVRDVPVPYFCYALIAICVAVYLLEQLYLDESALQPGALYGPLVRAGQWWRPLTFVFEHDRGFILHIGLNMSVVWTLGRELERAIGTWRFALISLVTCLGSATFALLVNFDAVTVGASGMILGWAGAMLPIASSAGRRSLLTWLAQVAVISLLPRVSWAGHLGGVVFGLLCGVALRFGYQRFKYLAPILVFLAAVSTVVAAHTEKLRP